MERDCYYCGETIVKAPTKPAITFISKDVLYCSQYCASMSKRVDMTSYLGKVMTFNGIYITDLHNKLVEYGSHDTQMSTYNQVHSGLATTKTYEDLVQLTMALKELGCSSEAFGFKVDPRFFLRELGNGLPRENVKTTKDIKEAIRRSSELDCDYRYLIKNIDIL